MPTEFHYWLETLPFETRHKLEMVCQQHDLNYHELFQALINDAAADLPYANATCSHRFHKHETPATQGTAP